MERLWFGFGPLPGVGFGPLRKGRVQDFLGTEPGARLRPEISRVSQEKNEVGGHRFWVAGSIPTHV